MKTNVLGVSAHRIVSADTAVQMAVGAADLLDADAAVATALQRHSARGVPTGGRAPSPTCCAISPQRG